MTSPGGPRILAEQGGLVVAEDGPHVLVIDRGSGLTQIAAFVLLVITLVFGGFGVVSTSMALGGAENNPPLVVGLVILAVGIAAAAALVFTVRSLRRIRSAPLSAFVPVAVFDRSDGTYRDGVGQVVGRLDQVRFEKRMQIGSSSPKLVAVTPHGAYVLKRGNPFGGRIHGMDAVLSTAIFGTER
ncbi:hypothetical protein [Mycolicibacterium frederiksbergense]|uniref:hypothetical protein n=1 Tax=Mycolicibacterium frederiksbergense TaxID=117567 RepID=UPI00265C309B|nr:hypothetical protein [Mycolicibacterium frederiksbergense]MDO0977048.1 hypothetical protein [Mycolicibacterium frederiksbergense]